ncbi:MAG: PD-(D/E)XK nuclease-like domain-containing protein [Magnetococcales bacterium]|nr:PD-(D/E)XK nuclease-like domain-containing protein [Magnetococcales bacterium]
MTTAMTIPFGVYFDLPAQKYHDDPALSQSGIKNLMVSPLTYWTNSAMNPDRDSTETPSMMIGSATHKRILEGPARFVAEYAVTPNREDHPDAVDGADALREVCRTLGVKISGTIPEMCERILDANPSAVLWPEIMRRFKAESEDKIILKADDGATINRMAAMVEGHPEAAFAFQGGFPEVSIFWPCPLTGVRLKARIDYLKPNAIVDLKTFANSKHFPIAHAVAMAVANYNLHVQAVFYIRAVKTARVMIKKGLIHGVSPDHPILQAIADSKTTKFFFVFVETGDVNNVLIREFPGPKALMYQTGQSEIDRIITLYQSLRDKFGTTPWNVLHETRMLDDAEFPAWIFKG